MSLPYHKRHCLQSIGHVKLIRCQATTSVTASLLSIITIKDTWKTAVNHFYNRNWKIITGNTKLWNAAIQFDRKYNEYGIDVTSIKHNSNACAAYVKRGFWVISIVIDSDRGILTIVLKKSIYDEN